MTSIIGNRVELQLLTTLRCNLKCSYCSESVGNIVNSQRNPQYSLDQLATFIDTHLVGKEIYTTFYGGEPTLNLPFMTKVMSRFSTFRFQLQTNGTLLRNLPEEVLRGLSNILVSVDGGELTTDYFRGKGVYRRVMDNVASVRSKVIGSLTARVTWSSPNTTSEDIVHLADEFDYIYFQFACGDFYRGDSVQRRKRELVKMIHQFFGRKGYVLPIIPIMGIVRNKLFPGRAIELYAGESQCRASTHLINVAPNGTIFPCPDMMHMPETQTGSVQENWLKPSPLRRPAGGACESCAAFAWCRGNCVKNLILADKDTEYRRTVTDPICDLVKFMGEEIDRYDVEGWFKELDIDDRAFVVNNQIYEYVEVMP